MTDSEPGITDLPVHIQPWRELKLPLADHLKQLVTITTPLQLFPDP
jgi:hypothetical protein